MLTVCLYAHSILFYYLLRQLLLQTIMGQEHDTIWQINETIKSLLLDYPLFGEVLIAVERQLCDRIPTLAVTSDFRLLVNKGFWDAITTEERKAVLSHEIMHLMFDHFGRFGHLFRKYKDYVNAALDCAINQLIPFTLPCDCITLEYIESIVGKKLEEKQTSEYYFRHLLKAEKEISDKLKELIDHSEQFEEGSVLDKSKMEELLKKAIEAQKDHERKAGTQPGDSLVSLIPDRVKTNGKVWKSLVNKAMGDVPTNPDYIYGKQSRRDRHSMYGKVMTLTNPHVWVVIDTSGSVQDHELSKFVGHINSAIRKFDVHATLVECDSDIQRVSEVRRKLPKVNIHGRGGTNLTNAMRHITDKSKGSPAKVVMMTDGETPWCDLPKNVEVTAIYTKNHTSLPGVNCSAVI